MMHKFFLPPRPLRRQLRFPYVFEGMMSHDDPLSYNIENELQERIDRLRAIIQMDSRINPDGYHLLLIERYQPYLDEAEAIMAMLDLAIAPQGR